ncbi:squalene/phytoene synthase family protein [Glacieibacterium sp.]|uniref:squalene/phytoene synthase family protein n=1 Tax=Glacieibacterium sp. TaxID=2860237 RepID=UPI003B007F81
MIADLVRSADRERWLAVQYAPAAVRPALLALHALDLELAKVVDTTTEPMLGEIRLAWWRERLEGLDKGQVPAQPVLQALATEVLPRGVTGAVLAGFEDAWLLRLGGDEVAAAQGRGRALFAAMAVLLGGDPVAAGALGETWAAGDAARYGLDGVALAPARAATALRPLAGLAALGARDHARAAAGLPIELRATPVRQLILLRGAVFGR